MIIYKSNIEQLLYRYRDVSSNIIFLSGKRHIGKTTFLSNFLNAIGKSIHDPCVCYVSNYNFTSASEILRFLTVGEKSSGKQILLLDNVDRLIKHHREALEEVFLQMREQDLSNIFLVCSGTKNKLLDEFYTFVYNFFLEADLDYKMDEIILEPLSFQEIQQFYSGKPVDEQLLIYGITGGNPGYLNFFPPKENLKKVMMEQLFSPMSYLYQEPILDLSRDLNEISMYMEILSAIGQGHRKLMDISEYTGMKQTSLSKYLNTLMAGNYVRREIPITEINPRNCKRGYYEMVDSFFQFWFQFIYPNRLELELGYGEEVFRKSLSVFPDYFQNTLLKKIVKESLQKYDFSAIGSWWQGNHKIDIVALQESNKSILFGSCGNYLKRMEIMDLEKLEHESMEVSWYQENRTNQFLLYNPSGYSKDLVNYVKKRSNVMLL